jgi:protein-arginine kinase
MTALAKFEEGGAKFAYDDHLGFITSCPTNLGTAMRASVHMHLPELSKNKVLFQSIADRHHVQIRGAHGEHTETNDGIFDISNKRRLGFSMTTLAQGWYDGVKAMLQEEIKLQNASKSGAPKKVSVPVKAGSHLKSPADITGMVTFPGDCKSLLCKYMTEPVYNAYCG